MYIHIYINIHAYIYMHIHIYKVTPDDNLKGNAFRENNCL